MALIAVSLWGTDYYVDRAAGSDTNPGSISSPWKTIQKANQTLQPGDVVYIRAGTYSNQTIQPTSNGLSDAQRIVYSSFPGEDVVIQESAYGIYLYKKSFITVNGIRFFSLRRFLRLYACHYVTIGYCSFDTRSPASGDWAGGRIANDFNDTTPASEPSTHNWVHHCSFFRWVYGAYAEHRGSLLDIGSNELAGDNSSYNLIEDNVFAYGGHHTLGVYAPFNVIRGNTFHNETNAANWAYEGYRASITEGPGAGRCLYEGNRYGHADASGMALRSPYNIFRFNLFYQNGYGGIQVVSSAAGIDHADDNRIYHNTFFHDGHLATDPGFQGGMYFANWSNQSPVGNIVKCNIFYDNKNGSITYEGSVQPQIVENNWDQNQLNPGLLDLTDGGPDDYDLPDLHLTAGSPAIDQSLGLTTIASPSDSGYSFQVADAWYFMDGWGVPQVQGDEIQLLGSAQRARIIEIDYGTNTITVNPALTWTQGQRVALAYEGQAPDLGAYEFSSGVPGTQTVSLVAGWNWVSFGILPADRSLAAVFNGILGQVQQVKSQGESALYAGGQWQGDLQNMDGIAQGKMYKIRVSAPCTLTVTGTRIAASSPIQLISGWNWIAFYTSTLQPINEALASITSQVQQAKSQTQSAIFQNGQWLGDLAQMEPGKGYTILMSGPGTLIYPGGQ